MAGKAKVEVRIIYKDGDSHARVSVFTPSGWTWDADWAYPPPSPEEVIRAWREDTNSGRRRSPNWSRR